MTGKCTDVSAAPATDLGLFYLIIAQNLAISFLAIKPLEVTHQKPDSSLSLSPLLFHSPSPRATHTRTHWNGMNQNLSLYRTKEEEKDKLKE